MKSQFMWIDAQNSYALNWESRLWILIKKKKKEYTYFTTLTYER